MLIQTIIQNEADRNKRMILEYKALIDGLPKGSLICRKNEYYYLKYRENGKLYDRYLGKDGDAVEVGTPILKVNLEGIKSEGYDIITPVIVTNTMDCGEVIAVSEGDIMPQETIIKVMK